MDPAVPGQPPEPVPPPPPPGWAPPPWPGWQGQPPAGWQGPPPPFGQQHPAGYAQPGPPGYAPPGYYPYPPPRTSHRGRNAALIAGGGCLVILVLLGVLAAVGIHAVSNAPLGTLPTPSSCHQSGFHISSGGGQSDETESWACDGNRADVEQGFSQLLPSHGWVIDERSTTQFAWRIHRSGQTGESGTITFSETGPSTTGVEVDYNY